MNINETLRLHKMWLEDKEDGIRADLSRANLICADLSGAGLICADFRGADLIGANLSHANLSGADLSYADLSDADLSHADLSDADLRCCIGNMIEVKSMQIDKWPVTYTSEVIQIGCQRHSIDLWRNSDPRWIATLDKDATEWWAKFGKIILGIIDTSPATPTPTARKK